MDLTVSMPVSLSLVYCCQIQGSNLFIKTKRKYFLIQIDVFYESKIENLTAIDHIFILPAIL